MRTFFKEYLIRFLMISRLIGFALAFLQLFMFKVRGVIGISKIDFFSFSERTKSYIDSTSIKFKFQSFHSQPLQKLYLRHEPMFISKIVYLLHFIKICYKFDVYFIVSRSPLSSVGKCPPKTFFYLFCFDNGYFKRFHRRIF